MQPHNQHPRHHNLQTCGGIKYIFPVCIKNTVNFKSHPRTSFRINEHWSIILNIHKSKINTIRLVQITWRIFYNKKNNKLTSISSYTQISPLPRLSTNLRGGQICISGLDKSHIIFSITLRHKYWYQLTLTRSMQTNKSRINDANIKMKTPKEIL